MAASDFTSTLRPKGSGVTGLIFKFHNNLRQLSIFFAEILHAGRGAIDIRHIKQDFSLKAWVESPGVDLGSGAEAKIKYFWNMVMLHIKLHAATW